MRKKLCIKNKAFSLLEVLLAVVLAALIIIPLSQAIITSMEINNRSRRILAADNIGVLVMEFLRSQSKEDIDKMIADNVVIKIKKDSTPEEYIFNGGKMNYDYNSGNDNLNSFVEYAQLRIHDVEDDANPHKQAFVISDTDKLDSFVMGNVKSDGFYYDIVVDFSPIFLDPDIDPADDSTYPEFYSYDTTVYVYWIDYKDYDNDSNGGHSTKYLLSTYSGSIFNKMK